MRRNLECLLWEMNAQAVLGQHGEALLKRRMDIERMKPCSGKLLNLLWSD